MTQCPDCDIPLKPILIIGGAAQVHYTEGLPYTDGDKPKFSAWHGKIKNSAGTVQGFLCGACQRVIFYAQPNSEDST